MVASTDEEGFEIGPLSDEVKKAAEQIRLVLTYVQQTPTLDALTEVCRNIPFNPYVARRAFYSSKEHFEDIRQVAGQAPLFKQLVDHLRKINDESIIPEKHIPGDKLVNKIVADYHA